ncbi:uncharacterized protein F5Z01DRAFT_675524 [Emericellopsis atlantica]|uniref:Uncharacterized protein n=1 Tax=Emericellopsis atlantica TaxID=2614577 RepID=A0A9P8CN54_9HYPO|nr:uncharacterized protein F5Z01DRAFT_675524 [Emericellopsis atlantica]KAG9253138.1 hypothetical protein F5Z01DRAFT_675524 [Emericellopsis atlantica]
MSALGEAPPTDSAHPGTALFKASTERGMHRVLSVDSLAQPRDESEALDEPPRSSRPLASHFKAWAPEAGEILLGIGLFVALVVILNTYNGQPLPQWPMGLTLNTIVALLATLCRSIIILPVTEGISQFKWNWFVAGKRPIKDLLIFDQASRGPWGSLRLLFRLHGRLMPLSHVAALVLVSGLATSFLTQSAVSYESRLAVSDKSGRATIKRASVYPATTGTEDSSGDLEVLKRTALQATFLHVDDHWPVPEPTCPSGNCDYPVYHSLGLCVSMENVTSELKHKEMEGKNGDTTARLSLLNGTVFMDDKVNSVVGLPDTVNATSPEPLDSIDMPDVSHMTEEEASDAMAEAMKNSIWPPERNSVAGWKNPDLLSATISQFFFIWTNDKVPYQGTSSRYRAAEVLWHICVYTYNTTARDGGATTDTLDSVTKIDSVIKKTGENAFNLTDKDGRDKFRVSNKYAYDSLDSTFRRAFQGAWSSLWGTDRDYSEISSQMARNLFDRGTDDYEAYTAMTAAERDDMLWSNLGKMTGTIAQSVTTYMRNAEKTDGEVVGQVLQTETFVVVRWAWLAFLAAQMGLTIVFVVAVAIHTARLDVDVVKSNNLSELFAQRGRGQEEEGEEEEEPLLGIKTQVDKLVKGRLVRTSEAWVLDVQREEAPDGKL